MEKGYIVVKGKEIKAVTSNWLSNGWNLLFLAILIFAFVIRIYFLIKTSGQTLWWDETEYLAGAKHFGIGLNYGMNPQRPILFQFLIGMFMHLSQNEDIIKFIFVVLPSVLLVFSTYLLGKELFSKKVGIIASAGSAFMWSFLFWTSRVQPDFFSVSFQLLSFAFIWKYFKTQEKENPKPIIKYAVYAGIFAALGIHFKVSGLLIPLIILIFILFKDNIQAFKDKGYWAFLIAFVLTLSPYILWSLNKSGKVLAFLGGYTSVSSTPGQFGWGTLSFFYLFPQTIFFILFLIGLFMSLEFLLYADVLLKDRTRRLNANIFSLLSVVLVSAFYIFYIRGIEDRWVFLLAPFIFFIAGNALLSLRNYFKIKETIFLALIIAILLISGFFQVSQANTLISGKLTSYADLKDAGMFLKLNSDKQVIVFSSAYPQMYYYSERKIYPYPDNESEFDKEISELHPKYMMLTMWEQSPQWAYFWPENHSAELEVAKAFAFNGQPSTIIYKFIYLQPVQPVI